MVSGRGQREEVALRLREARGSTDAVGQWLRKHRLGSLGVWGEVVALFVKEKHRG